MQFDSQVFFIPEGNKNPVVQIAQDQQFIDNMRTTRKDEQMTNRTKDKNTQAKAEQLARLWNAQETVYTDANVFTDIEDDEDDGI